MKSCRSWLRFNCTSYKKHTVYLVKYQITTQITLQVTGYVPPNTHTDYALPKVFIFVNATIWISQSTHLSIFYLPINSG